MKTLITLALVAAGGLYAGTEDTVRIGIMSDTHVGAKGCAERLEKAYGLFSKLGVDRIFNLGDICERHDPRFFAKYVEVRTRVYGDKLPPETYVYANHDCSGLKGVPIRDDREHSAVFAKAKAALGIPNERYDSFEIAGFRFLVFPQYRDSRRIEEMLVRAAGDGSRPVFVLDHVPPTGTVDRSDMSGNPESRRLYGRFPQVVTLSGHVHSSLACAGNVWQGEFTALGFGSLKNTCDPSGLHYVAVLELFPQKAVIRRYELNGGTEIDPDDPWTLRFPYVRGDSAPYAFERRSRQVGRPAFPDLALPQLVRVGKRGDEIVVRYPSADRGWCYFVDAFVNGAGGWKLRTTASRIYGNEASFNSALFTSGESVRFVVRPMGAFRDEGASISYDTWLEGLATWRVLYEGVPEPAKPGQWMDFKGGTWLSIPQSAMDVPAGTPMRIVIDAETEIKPTESISFNLRTDRSAKYAFGYIHTPLGSCALRYAKAFKRPKEGDEPYNLFVNSSNWAPISGRIRINGVKVECR